MKNGMCPNCGSKNIYTKPKGAQFGSGGFFVSTSMVSSPVNYDSYICGIVGCSKLSLLMRKSWGK
jgi:hypothetical protein